LTTHENGEIPVLGKLSYKKPGGPASEVVSGWGFDDYHPFWMVSVSDCLHSLYHLGPPSMWSGHSTPYFLHKDKYSEPHTKAT
jgi:hypothetical protein